MTTGCSALGEEAGDSGVPASGRICWRLNSRLDSRGLKQDCYVSEKSTNVQANVIYLKIVFFRIGIGLCYFFQNKPFCAFKQNVASLDCLVRSSCPQLHGIVNLIQILPGGLEIVLLWWRTLPLTDLHLAKHLWSKRGGMDWCWGLFFLNCLWRNHFI